MNNRLFVIGCSYTSYNWPGYGEFLGAGYKEQYNFGQSGAGNEYIFNTAVAVFNKYKPTADDTVIIQWSSVPRKDLILYNTSFYNTPGNLASQTDYPEEYITKFYNVVQAAYNLISYVTGIEAMAKVHSCKFITFNMFDPWIDLFYGEPGATPLFDKHLKYILEYYPFEKLRKAFEKVNHCISLEEFCWQNREKQVTYNFYNDSLQEDGHPSPMQHFKFAKFLNKNYNLGLDKVDGPQTLHVANLYQQFFKDKSNVDFDKNENNLLLKTNKFPDGTFQSYQTKVEYLEEQFNNKIFNNCFSLEHPWMQ